MIEKKIVGVGNALVDFIVSLNNEEILRKFSLKKGGMEMIDSQTKQTLFEELKDKTHILASGGSTSNSIHGLARLGISAGYIGKIKEDDLGVFFRNDLKNSNIKDHLILTNLDTGVAITLMTADAERTFATYLGAAATMLPDEINPLIFKDYQYILIEGYLVFNKELIIKLCRIAKEHNLKIAMDMASYNLVESRKELFEFLLKNYVDIIFANEEEARAFTGKEGREALQVLSQYCSIAVVKLGCQGSVVNNQGEITKISACQVNAVDTNGAGDIYAAGFLYGLMKGLSMEETGFIASRLAAEMVKTVGAKLSDNQWEKIKKELQIR
jgi:sugar/nucleoside kinase (ribokinase family)